MTNDYRANVIPPEKIHVTVNISIQLFQVISVNEPEQVHIFGTIISKILLQFKLQIFKSLNCSILKYHLLPAWHGWTLGLM